MRLFKNIKGERIDPVEHTLKILRDYPTVKIHIGSDSQNIGKKTKYATVIAYRYGSRGVHYILSKKTELLIKDMWTRLWKEAEMSIDIAQWLTHQVSVRVEIDMDYNSDENFKSSKLISATKGWANSLGYKVNVKPNNQIATKAADYHCK
ncbi:MAG: hypothetical protein CMC78_02770 [Flavobacteriaceae bacterium]|jgi:predicted RNase H-related nuclease YkuK (DUF458 family)|nr:hypothetical protein [Flavobacteriaceae bacterium]|tara:strand:+ start:143 stop:592 length:450 start_codon:yes stop_codon:yes gene_type:complete